jgi:polyisoprenoid-binding protein YceI
MKTTSLFMLALALAVPAPSLAQNIQGRLDPDHSSASFTVKHFTITNVSGTIAIQDASIVLGKDHTIESARASLDLSTIDTHQSQRDNDLHSARWFDVASYPMMTFKSTSIAAGPNGTTNVTGDLTFHGITKPATLVTTYTGTVKDMKGRTHDGFSATATIDRTVWNLGAGFPPAIVGNDVVIDLQLDVIEG